MLYLLQVYIDEMSMDDQQFITRCMYPDIPIQLLQHMVLICKQVRYYIHIHDNMMLKMIYNMLWYITCFDIMIYVINVWYILHDVNDIHLSFCLCTMMGSGHVQWYRYIFGIENQSLDLVNIWIFPSLMMSSTSGEYMLQSRAYILSWSWQNYLLLFILCRFPTGNERITIICEKIPYILTKID